MVWLPWKPHGDEDAGLQSLGAASRVFGLARQSWSGQGQRHAPEDEAFQHVASIDAGIRFL